MARMIEKAVRPVVEPLLNKYRIPEWVRPYLYEYLSEELQSNPIAAIKRAASFIEIGRRKGIITKSYVMLPNGVKFDIASITHLLSMFLYGEERISEIGAGWAREADAARLPEYARHFHYLSEKDMRHARAIKNLIAGLEKRVEPPGAAIREVFDFIEGIRDWNERIITSSVVLNQPYSVMGMLLYRTFYPASSEFMRNFGKAMGAIDEEERWGAEESARILSSGSIASADLMDNAEKLLALVHLSIDSEMRIARKAGIEREIKLLRDISILYPLHTLQEMGVSIDMAAGMRSIRKKVEGYKSLQTKTNTKQKGKAHDK
jgi:hypothetical protein